jgi:hypothetical protein
MIEKIDEAIREFAEKQGFKFKDSIVPESTDEAVEDPTKF